jgi:hypothetical protein
MSTTRRTLLLSFAVAGALCVAPAEAGSVSQTVPFEMDKWYALDSAEGSVTLHRIQLTRQRGLLTKSTVFRPGNAEFLASVEIKLEYSNSGTRDWKAKFKLAWLDDEGREIDGYNGSEDLDDKEDHQLVTVKLSTLQYGLSRAKKLRLAIDYNPD